MSKLPNHTEYDYLLKMLIIGDSGTGKSSIVLRECDDTFTDTFISTIGVDFKIKTVEKNGKVIKMQIWDTAGQERFRTITSSYYRGSQGIFLIFDLTDKETFDNIRLWLTECERFASPSVKKILVGNKCDLESHRKIPYTEAKAFADENGMDYIETSAKKSNNICVLFDTMIKIILDGYEDSIIKKSKNQCELKFENSTEINTSCCSIL